VTKPAKLSLAKSLLCKATSSHCSEQRGQPSAISSQSEGRTIPGLLRGKPNQVIYVKLLQSSLATLLRIHGEGKQFSATLIAWLTPAAVVHRRGVSTTRSTTLHNC
jgi:hypothetical protein